jgi:hypothetical protein
MNYQSICWNWFYLVDSPCMLAIYFQLNFFQKVTKIHLVMPHMRTTCHVHCQRDHMWLQCTVIWVVTKKSNSSSPQWVRQLDQPVPLPEGGSWRTLSFLEWWQPPHLSAWVLVWSVVRASESAVSPFLAIGDFVRQIGDDFRNVHQVGGFGDPPNVNRSKREASDLSYTAMV